MKLSLWCLLLLFNLGWALAQNNTDEEEAREFLASYDAEYGNLLNHATVASWNYETNITSHNAELSSAAWLALDLYQAEAAEEAREFESSEFSEDTRRQLSRVGSLALSDSEMRELKSLILEMGEIYGSTEVCLPWAPPETSCYNLEPGLTEIMAESTNYTERQFVWQQWRTQVGRQIKPLYARYVQLKNKLAVLNGFQDAGDQWRSKYETEDFEGDVLRLYSELEPLYKELHAYIRRKLYDVYGGELINLQGPLPAHLLSDMWGRFWNNLYKVLTYSALIQYYLD